MFFSAIGETPRTAQQEHMSLKEKAAVFFSALGFLFALTAFLL